MDVPSETVKLTTVPLVALQMLAVTVKKPVVCRFAVERATRFGFVVAVTL